MLFCESSCRTPQGVRCRSITTVVGACALSIGLVAASWAQSTVVIGGSGRPSVEVNLDVLDQPRGQYSGLNRRLLMPGERPTEVVRLREPGSGSRNVGARAAPRLTLQRPVSAPRPRPVQQAARPMPAAPSPPVTQRAVPAPTPRVARAPARVAPPPPPKAPPPAKAPAPKKMAAAPAPSPAPPPPPVVKAPPPPVPKASPPPAAKAPPPPPAQTAMAKPEPKASPPSVQQRREDRQAAALPRMPLPSGGGQVLRVDFLGASTRLTPDAERRLGSLATTMTESDGRLQLKAYAGGTGETLSSARRLSLSRALAVRSYLIEKGIRSTRIDVRALGRAEDSGPPERVDIILLMQ